MDWPLIWLINLRVCIVDLFIPERVVSSSSGTTATNSTGSQTFNITVEEPITIIIEAVTSGTVETNTAAAKANATGDTAQVSAQVG